MDSLPYKCGACNRAYKNVCSLKRHRKEHHNNTRYYCADCNKGYSRPDEVYRHRRMAHPNLKPKELHKKGARKESHNIVKTTAELMGLTASNNSTLDMLKTDLALSSDSETSLPDMSTVISKVSVSTNKHCQCF